MPKFDELSPEDQKRVGGMLRMYAALIGRRDSNIWLSRMSGIPVEEVCQKYNALPEEVNGLAISHWLTFVESVNKAGIELDP